MGMWIMENYSETLRNIRKEINRKVKEIQELNNYNEEVWLKVEKECRDNLIYFKKKTNDKLVEFHIRDMGSEQVLCARFDATPSAKELSSIEEDTGLKFYKMTGFDYYFKLD